MRWHDSVVQRHAAVAAAAAPPPPQTRSGILKTHLQIEMSDPRPGNSETLRWAAEVRVADDFLLIYDGMPFLADLARAAEAHAFATSEVIGTTGDAYLDPTMRTSRRVCISAQGAPPELVAFSFMARVLEGRYAETYTSLVNKHAIVSEATGYDLLRYTPGEFFAEHVDAVKLDVRQETHPRDRLLLAMRRIAVVGFCNDNFTGGELRFPRQGFTITPEKGLVVLFPAGFTHPHEVVPVRSGTRYSLVTWFI